MTQELHVLADEDQMTARTKQFEGEKHTGIKTEKKKKRRREQGKKSKKLYPKLKASIVTKLTVSATKCLVSGTEAFDWPTLITLRLCIYFLSFSLSVTT